MPNIHDKLAAPHIAAAMIAACLLIAPLEAARAATIYDTQVLKHIKFAPAQRAKVRRVLRRSDREMAAIFRKHGINPRAKPVFAKLRKASRELQALEAREKRKMKTIMSPAQYRVYLDLLDRAAARVIKAARTKP